MLAALMKSLAKKASQSAGRLAIKSSANLLKNVKAFKPSPRQSISPLGNYSMCWDLPNNKAEIDSQQFVYDILTKQFKSLIDETLCFELSPVSTANGTKIALAECKKKSCTGI